MALGVGAGGARAAVSIKDQVPEARVVVITGSEHPPSPEGAARFGADINLPGIDGYEVLKRLQDNATTKAIPVIAISANAMPADIEKGKQAGFNNYLTKPINIPNFFDAIDKVLGR